MAPKTLSSIGYATERMLAVLASGVIATVGLIAVLGFGPDIEEKLRPILSAQVVTDISREGRVMTFSMLVQKERSCRFVDGDWAVSDNGRHYPVVVVNAAGRSVAGTTYPTGSLQIGPFKASLPFDVLEGAVLYANLFYDCHFGWLSRQVLGPVPIPPLGPARLGE